MCGRLQRFPVVISLVLCPVILPDFLSYLVGTHFHKEYWDSKCQQGVHMT